MKSIYYLNYCTKNYVLLYCSGENELLFLLFCREE